MVGGFTFISRILGIARDLLLSRYIGATSTADIFFTAYKIPNSLRKIFAEGVLSAAVGPTITQTMRVKGPEAVAKLMAVAFLLFEGTLLVLSCLGIYYAETIIHYTVMGFSPEKAAIAASILQILIPYAFFISISALLASALQSVNHFFVPAVSPILLNVFFIAGIGVCFYGDLSIAYLCWFIIAGAIVQLMWHIIAYVRFGFKIGPLDGDAIWQFKPILGKFFLLLPAVGVEEGNLFINTSFASYLADGSISLLTLAHRFMLFPLGVFGHAISTILMPHFTKTSLYAPKRLHFYLHEAVKLIIWLMLPLAIFMIFFSSKIFITIFLSKKFTLEQSYKAGLLLQIYLVGLIFIAFNKIMRIMFYSLHNTWLPAMISLATVFVNFFINKNCVFLLQAPGLAFATTVSSIIQTMLFALFLKIYFNFKLYFGRLFQFLVRYTIQLLIVAIPFCLIYYILQSLIVMQSAYVSYLLLDTILFWFWSGPLYLLFLLSLLKLRNRFTIKLYFID